MNHRRFPLWLCTVMLFVSQFASANSSPVTMLEQAAQSIIATLDQNQSSLKKNPDIVQQAVRQHLLPIVDVDGMSRSVLGRQAWNAASAGERSEFTKAFTRLVIRTYATPLAEYTNEKIKFLPQRAPTSGQFTRVNSVIIRANGQNIPLSYSLVSKNGQWKIYDLSVEGVSLLQSFHNQFGQALKNASMSELITQMKQTKQAQSVSKA
jgi:phospholipid transport system substrate-binding protein